MPTTIEQIRKVNVYEEDANGNRTLVQENVPLGSNVELKEKAPENSELSLLSGEKDVTANVIKLYPTAAKISSDGKINFHAYPRKGKTSVGEKVLPDIKHIAKPA